MWKRLAIFVKYGPVDMVTSCAVGIIADIHDTSFAPVRSEWLIARTLLIIAVSPCTSTVALCMADFVALANQPKSRCLFVFPVYNNSCRTAVFRTDGRARIDLITVTVKALL